MCNCLTSISVTYWHIYVDDSVICNFSYSISILGEYELLLWAFRPPAAFLFCRAEEMSHVPPPHLQLSDPRPTFKQCAGWIWVTVGLCGAVLLKERRHEHPLCTPQKWKWGQLQGDNDNCLGMHTCACWALFMKLYCTSNDPRIHRKPP